jgi:hypothetical protein
LIRTLLIVLAIDQIVNYYIKYEILSNILFLGDVYCIKFIIHINLHKGDFYGVTEIKFVLIKNLLTVTNNNYHLLFNREKCRPIFKNIFFILKQGITLTKHHQ